MSFSNRFVSAILLVSAMAEIHGHGICEITSIENDLTASETSYVVHNAQSISVLVNMVRLPTTTNSYQSATHNYDLVGTMKNSWKLTVWVDGATCLGHVGGNVLRVWI